MLTYLLDTNTVSYIVRGRSPLARRKLTHLPLNEQARISAITEGEIRYGLAKSPGAHQLRAAMDVFFTKVQILPWRTEEAIVYGQLRAALRAQGKSLGPLDMLIAAHAIAIGATLVTSDKAFHHVSDLHNIMDWATDL